MSNIVRIIIACALLAGAITLFVFKFWGWGSLVLLVAILVFVTVVFNEHMLIAQHHLRKERMEKAAKALGRITNYEKQLIRMQHGYYFLLIGLIESQKAPLQSEKFFKRALSLGLHMDHNIA